MVFVKFSPAEKGSFSVTSSRAAVSPASPIKFDGTPFEAEMVSALDNQSFIAYSNGVLSSARSLSPDNTDYPVYLLACRHIKSDASRRIAASSKGLKLFWGIFAFCIVGFIAMIPDNIVAALFYLAVSLFVLFVALSKKSAQRWLSESLRKIASASSQQVDAMGGNVKFTESGSITTERAPQKQPSFSSSANYERFHVAGVSFHQDEIASLGYENSDYDMSKKEIIDSSMENEKIYAVEFDPQRVELEPEPDNPHDPNAIKVIVDGVHVGYIKKGSTAHVRNLLAAGGKVSAEIYGGKYKMLCHYDEDDDDVYEMECDEDMYGVTVSISK
ncbi:HIRAN domain-containing protein [Angelakisella massiliensis]|uniref:HIRAN domain-containing protein n=1 Tax=Angelakisella massiliensis TaxID=1871018 RepID=UPI0024B0497D|nr:HIRAN domain-containing protein [Angelakisella massiliensis]